MRDKMAIIDFHTHIFADEIAARGKAALEQSALGVYSPVHDMTLAGMLSYMDKCGVDKSVVLPVPTKPTQTRKINEWAASIESDKIVPFGGIYPTENYKDDIDFICSLGLKGIKLHAEYQNFCVDEKRMLALYDYAFSKGLIIVQHCGFDPAFSAPYRSSSKMFASVIKQLQGGIMVVAHFGGRNEWQDCYDYLAGTDVYIDTSLGGHIYGQDWFEKIVKKHGADKILFATDSPWSDAKKEIDFVNSTSLSIDEKKLILGGNAERILKL